MKVARPKLDRAVGIGVFVVQVFVAGSYSSTVERLLLPSKPPTA
jgi:hypothetical protein